MRGTTLDRGRRHDLFDYEQVGHLRPEDAGEPIMCAAEIDVVVGEFVAEVDGRQQRCLLDAADGVSGLCRRIERENMAVRRNCFHLATLDAQEGYARGRVSGRARDFVLARLRNRCRERVERGVTARY
jgi:hypothetical protein